MKIVEIGYEYENFTLAAMMANKIGKLRYNVSTGAEDDEQGRWKAYTTIVCKRSTALTEDQWQRIYDAKSPEEILEVAHEFVQDIEGR